MITDHFSLVTSNLMNQYLKASEIVSTSFIERNPMQVHDAINSLIEGQNKMSEGTQQKFFDHRDIYIDKLRMQDLEDLQSPVQNDGGSGDKKADGWVNVTKD